MSPEGDLSSRAAPKAAALLFRALPSKTGISVPEKRALKDFTQVLSARVAGSSTFLCLITNDRELHRLNRQFLGHDYPTDVLSFPTGERSGDLGEMAISIGRAQEQAALFGHSCFDEIRILMLHGLLHLIGFDHERDHGQMARAERKWRAALGLPPGLIARSRQISLRRPAAARAQAPRSKEAKR